MPLRSTVLIMEYERLNRVFERLVLRSCDGLPPPFQRLLYSPWLRRRVESRGASPSPNMVSRSKVTSTGRRERRVRGAGS